MLSCFVVVYNKSILLEYLKIMQCFRAVCEWTNGEILSDNLFDQKVRFHTAKIHFSTFQLSNSQFLQVNGCTHPGKLLSNVMRKHSEHELRPWSFRGAYQSSSNQNECRIRTPVRKISTTRHSSATARVAWCPGCRIRWWICRICWVGRTHRMCSAWG